MVDIHGHDHLIRTLIGNDDEHLLFAVEPVAPYGVEFENLRYTAVPRSSGIRLPDERTSSISASEVPRFPGRHRTWSVYRTATTRAVSGPMTGPRSSVRCE